MTLFERLQAAQTKTMSAMLTTQYRMHKAIMQWSSDEFYGGMLHAHPSVASHTLATLQVYPDCFCSVLTDHHACVCCLHATYHSSCEVEARALALCKASDALKQNQSGMPLCA